MRSDRRRDRHLVSAVRRIGLAGAVAGLLVVICAARVEAQDLRVGVSADSVTVGQRFLLSVTAYHGYPDEPTFPDPAPGDSLLFGDLEVMRRHARATFFRDGARVDSVVYEVTTFALDSARIGSIPVTFRVSEDTFTVRSFEAFIPVTSLVPEDADDVRELAPLLEFRTSTWPYVAGAAALLLLALFGFLLWRRRRDRVPEPVVPVAPPVTPPHVEALRRLRDLEHTDLSDLRAIKPFYVEMTDVLRLYLARRLDVPALETTSGELIGELRLRHALPPEAVERLWDVLAPSDLVKFAHFEPTPDEGYDALRRSQEFVLHVEDVLHLQADGAPMHVPDRR
jgi:LPXTG-motif cell wall-anchored protein